MLRKIDNNVLTGHIFSGYHLRQLARHIYAGRLKAAKASKLARTRADITWNLKPDLELAARKYLARLLSRPDEIKHLLQPSPKDSPFKERYHEPKEIKLTNNDRENIFAINSLFNHMVSIRMQDESEMKGYVRSGKQGWYLLEHVADPYNPQGRLMYDSELPDIKQLRNAVVMDYGTCA